METLDGQHHEVENDKTDGETSWLTGPRSTRIVVHVQGTGTTVTQ